MCLSQDQITFIFVVLPLILLGLLTGGVALSAYLIVKWARRRSAQIESGEPDPGNFVQLNILHKN